MSAYNIQLVAGLCTRSFDAIRRYSEDKFAPNGKLLLKNVKWPGYPPQLGAICQAELQEAALALPESVRVSFTVAYVDYHDATTSLFRHSCFPYALARPLTPLIIPDNVGRDRTRGIENEYANYVADETRELRRRAALVSEHTQVQNITPLLLPHRNFVSAYFGPMLRRLFDGLGTAQDVASLLRRETKEFLRHHPRTYPGDSSQSCFTDGVHFFESPGRHRHGYYQHRNGHGHASSCLLNARSRLGGSYQYNFHFDCKPVHGGLRNEYANCHDGASRPTDNQFEKKHINISPNDYVG